MRLHRFYVVQPLGEDVVINDVSLIKQWTSVFRYTTNDSVILFNGDGNDIVFSITSIDKKECVLTRKEQMPSFIPNKKVTLYLSCIKKDNFELVAQKAAEIGVTSIVPIISERSEKKNLNHERLEKIVIEASEQCGRGDIPVISSIISLKEALDMISKDSSSSSIVLQMNGSSWKDFSTQKNKEGTSSVNLFVGPEGGWSATEEALFAQHHVIPVSLGETVLRAETAAILACGFAFCA